MRERKGKQKERQGKSPTYILQAQDLGYSLSTQRNLIHDNEPHGPNASSHNRCKAYHAGSGQYRHISAVFMGRGSQR